MLLAIIKLTGRLIVLCPEFLLRLFAQCLGSFLYYGYASRRKTMLHSLACSFPEKPSSWHRHIGRTSCIRLIETGLLSLAAPSLSEKRILTMAAMSPSARAYIAGYVKTPKPLVFGTVHLAYWEGLTWLPLLLGSTGSPELLTIYRPMRNPAMDDWLRTTRERFGVKLMSRRSGLHAASHQLQRKGCVTILFDQSAGSHGYLTRFLGRECSTTPLLGMLAEKAGADIGLIYARRTGFWRFTVEIKAVETDCTEKAVTLALNREFESLLRSDEEICASWLWLHQRWRILDRPEEKRKLVEHRGGLIE